MRKTCLCHMRTTKAQISLRIRAVWSVPLLFAAWIVQYLYFLYPKFQASIWLLWLRRPVWVLPGCRPRRQVFSWHGSVVFKTALNINILHIKRLFNNINVYGSKKTNWKFLHQFRIIDIWPKFNHLFCSKYGRFYIVWKGWLECTTLCYSIIKRR